MRSMVNNSLNQRSPDTLDGIEFRQLLSKLRQRWKLYIIGITIALSFAFLYHTYSTPRYLVVSTLLHNIEQPSVLDESRELEWQNILNDLEVLRSTQVMRRAIERAQLYHQVYEKELFHLKSVDDKPPVILQVNITDPQAIFDLYADFDLVDSQTIHVKSTNIPSLEVGRSHSLPLVITAEALTVEVHKGHYESTSDRAYFFRIEDPLSRALEIKENMEVELASTQSTVIKMQVESPDPPWTIDFINRLILDYQSLKIEHKNESILNSLNFIKEQVAMIKGKLNQIEYDLVRFRERNKTIDINAEGSAVLTTLLDLENQLASKRLQLNYYSQFTAQMSSSDSNQVFVNPSAVGITDRVFNEAVTSLNSMILDLNQLRTSSTEINPRYKSLERSISHQTDLLRSSINDYKASTELSIDQLERRIREQEAEMQKLPATQKNLISLQREFDINETMYLFLEQRRAEAEILKASNISQIQIIDSPYISKKVFPREMINYLVAMLVACFLVYFGTTLYDLSVQKLDSAEDLRTKTQLPVIGSIPERKGKVILPSNEAPPSEVTESFRRLTTHLRQSLSDQKVIQVCSASDKEGRTYVAVNLAIMLARYKNSVILVDANLRDPRISQFIKLDSTAVISSYLEGRKEVKDIIDSTDIPNLHAIDGYRSEDGNELLNTPRLTELLNALKETYDYVVVDTAPLGRYPDALDLLAFADYKLFVVSKSHTSSLDLAVLDDINGSKERNLGLIFNRQRQPIC